MQTTLAEICCDIRAQWQQAAPGVALTCGLDIADSDDPAIARLRERGAHFAWVAAPVLGTSIWDAHAGIVVDPATGRGRAGFHIDPNSPVANGRHLHEALAATGPARLQHDWSASTGEEQWNSDEADASTPDGRAALIAAVLEISALLATSTPKHARTSPEEGQP